MSSLQILPSNNHNRKHTDHKRCWGQQGANVKSSVLMCWWETVASVFEYVRYRDLKGS